MKALKLGYKFCGESSYDSFGRRMREARENARMDVKKASEATGYSESQIRRIERGQVQMSAQSKSLVNCAKAYGVSAVWLYAGEAAGKSLAPEWYRPVEPSGSV